MGRLFGAVQGAMMGSATVLIALVHHLRGLHVHQSTLHILQQLSSQTCDVFWSFGALTD